MLIARSLLLAATGEYTYQEIAREIDLDGSRIDPEDIADLPQVLNRLKQVRIPGVSAVWRRLAATTQEAVVKNGGRDSSSEQLRAALAGDLTSVVRSGVVFNQSHFEFLHGTEDLQAELGGGPQDVQLWGFNRRLLTKIFEGDINASRSGKASVSQIQTWVSRFREQRLDGVLINRHARPRRGATSLDLLVWLIAGMESGKVTDAKGVVSWLRRRSRACRLKASTAERYLRNWARLRRKPLPERLRIFLMNSGFIHRFSTVRHDKVVAALEQLRREVPGAPIMCPTVAG